MTYKEDDEGHAHFSDESILDIISKVKKIKFHVPSTITAVLQSIHMYIRTHALQLLKHNSLICYGPPLTHTHTHTQLLEIPVAKLKRALTHRLIETAQEKFMSPLSAEQAQYARDAFAKSMYERLFCWLVHRLNASLQNKVRNGAGREGGRGRGRGEERERGRGCS